MGGRHRVVRDTDQGAIVSIHVQPNASSTSYAGEYGPALKVRIAKAPADGAANAELVRFLSNRFSIPRRRVQIVGGAGSRRKLVLLRQISAERVSHAFGLPSDQA